MRWARGFAVVAGEVKDLAAETARATENISRQIASPQADSTDAGMAIGGISTTVNQIAGAVEDQSTATGGISDRVDQATGGTTEIARRVETLTGTSRETSTAAGQPLQAAEELATTAASLQAVVAEFRGQLTSHRDAVVAKRGADKGLAPRFANRSVIAPGVPTPPRRRRPAADRS